MDSLEAIKVVNERIKKLETEQIARKVLGYVYLQDYPEQEMIRLAFSPDSAIQNLILKAKAAVDFPPILPSLNPISIPDHLLQDACFSSASQRHRVLSPRLGGSRLWEYRETEQQAVHNSDFKALSYSDRLQNQFMGLKDQFEPLDSVASSFSDYFCNKAGVDNVSLLLNQNMQGALEVPVETCHYFIKGFCKHGNNCRYFHGQCQKNFSDNFGPKPKEFVYEEVFLPGSLKRLEMEITELLKSRGGGPMSISFLPTLYFERYGRTIRAEDYPTESQTHGKTSSKLTKLLVRLNNTIRLLYKPNGQNEIELADHVPKYLGVEAERNDPAPIVGSSCKIFFTFPVGSTFTKRDISNYFSTFGPVEEVRIPRNQKGVYGFVTFSSSDTVKIILAKGNPHYVRGARVLVKPHEEKRKDHEQLDSSLYSSSHMYSNSELKSIVKDSISPIPYLDQPKLATLHQTCRRN